MKTEAIELKDKDGSWLGYIVIADNHLIMGYTDWGNFVYKWNKTSEDFKEFLLRINTGYFAEKIYLGYTYVSGTSKKLEKNCLQLSEKILPVLQEYLKSELTDSKEE
jgi:hypothetical protein